MDNDVIEVYFELCMFKIFLILIVYNKCENKIILDCSDSGLLLINVEGMMCSIILDMLLK